MVADIGTIAPADLLVFLSAIDAGSLTGAADRLGLPKSTVSRRLARLEQALGARLFERARGGMRLTDHGRLVVDPARAALADLEAVLTAVAGTRTEPRGPLRVSMSTDLAGLRALWVDFCVRYPEVELDVGFTNEYVDLAAERRHLALRGGLGEDQALVARRLGTYVLHAVAAPDYLARRGRPRSRSDLPSHDRVLLKPERVRSGSLPQTPRGRRLVLDDLTAAHAACVAGLGIAYLPAYACREDVAAGRLEVLADETARIEVPVYAVYPDRNYLPASHTAFMDHVHEVLGRHAGPVS